MRWSMQHHVTWAKGSCYRDADRVKSVLCVSVFMCVHDVCFENPLSRRGLNRTTSRGVMCKRQVSMCVQMAERRAAASTQKQPRGEKKYMYLFECMDVCLPDNLPQNCAGLHPRGDFLLHTYLNRVFIYRLLSHNIILCPILYMSSIFFLPSVSVSILYYVTISNVPAPIIQVKFLLHLLYPTWQTKGFPFLLLSALIQFISPCINSDTSAGNEARMLNLYSFFGLNGETSKAGQVISK